MTKNKTIIKLSALTDVGREREHNEDNFLVISDVGAMSKTFGNSQDTSLPERGALLVVADGMGGMSSGEVASRLAIESVEQDFSELRSKEMPDARSIKSFLKRAIHNAQTRIIKHQHQYPETQGMGTTLVIAWVCHSDKVYVAWVGDSRCYVYNKSHGLKQLSKDHSYVQELIDAGKITEEQAFYHPDSNIVTQSLGSEKHDPKPDVIEYSLQMNDKLLLCSDGLNGMLQDSEIGKIISQTSDLDDCRQSLIDAANQAGGNDNITVALCDIVAIYPSSATPPKKSLITANNLYAFVALFVIFAAVLLSSIIWSSFQDSEKNTAINSEKKDSIEKKDDGKKQSLVGDTLKKNGLNGEGAAKKQVNTAEEEKGKNKGGTTEDEENNKRLNLDRVREIMQAIDGERVKMGSTDSCEVAKEIQGKFYQKFKKYVLKEDNKSAGIDDSAIKELNEKEAESLKAEWDTAKKEINKALETCKQNGQLTPNNNQSGGNEL